MAIQYVMSKPQQVAIASSIVVYCDRYPSLLATACADRVKRQRVVCCDLDRSAERRRVTLPAIFKVR